MAARNHYRVGAIDNNILGSEGLAAIRAAGDGVRRVRVDWELAIGVVRTMPIVGRSELFFEKLVSLSICCLI